MSSLTPFVPPSCLVVLKKNEKKLTSEGRDKKEERLEFASDVIPFKEFNRKLKELMADLWPMDTFKTPLIEINGQDFTPKSEPIIIKKPRCHCQCHIDHNNQIHGQNCEEGQGCRNSPGKTCKGARIFVAII